MGSKEFRAAISVAGRRAGAELSRSRSGTAAEYRIPDASSNPGSSQAKPQSLTHERQRRLPAHHESRLRSAALEGLVRFSGSGPPPAGNEDRGRASRALPGASKWKVSLPLRRNSRGCRAVGLSVNTTIRFRSWNGAPHLFATGACSCVRAIAFSSLVVGMARSHAFLPVKVLL